MFLKPILMLVLFIAIAALGSNYVGDGLFDFQKKAKAARMVEFNRDLSTVMTAFKADEVANQSAAFLVDLDDAANPGTYIDVVALLAADNLLKGDGTPDFGVQNILTNGTDVVLVNSSDQISDEICDKINEVLGEPIPTSVDMTNAATDLDILVSYDVATDTAGGAIPALHNGGVEGVCVKDLNGDLNTFAFYVQQY